MSLSTHHLYVHVPFCRLVCAYCDFVTVGGRGAEIARYADALLAELALRPASGQLATIYFGGGTPSLLPGRRRSRAWSAAAVDRWGNAPDRGHPRGQPQLPRDARLGGPAGGRREPHLARHPVAARRGAPRPGSRPDRGRGAGCLRGGAGGGLRERVDRPHLRHSRASRWPTGATACGARSRSSPDHLSLYALQLALAPDEWAAPPRPGALRWRQRMVPRQDDGLAAAQYQLAEELLGRAPAIGHYELSLVGAAGLRVAPQLGLLGAAAVHRDRRRRALVRRRSRAPGTSATSTDTWRAPRPASAPLAGSEELDEPTRAFEAVALGLRRVDGFSRAAFAAEFGDDPVDRFTRRRSKRRSPPACSRWRTTRSGSRPRGASSPTRRWSPSRRSLAGARGGGHPRVDTGPARLVPFAPTRLALSTLEC